MCLVCTFPVRAEQRSLEDVIDEVNPSVVSIAVDISDSEQALGAGIIISADGYVVTNAHVMENADKITVQTPDGETFDAKLIGIDEKQVSLIPKHQDKGFCHRKPIWFGQ